MGKKVFSPIAIQALKEALSQLYWFKGDLKSFLHGSIPDHKLLGKLNWENYKRQIASDAIDHLVNDQLVHLDTLTKICDEICKITNFQHLENLENGKEKAKRAKLAIDNLRNLYHSHVEKKSDDEDIEKRTKAAEVKLKNNRAVQLRLEEVKNNYFKLLNLDPKKRGFELEKLLYDLFELFDLDPRASFKIEGEQIDGAFNLDSFDYIFEAKWQAEPTPMADLDIFSSKIGRKLDNTLGLFLSISGFNQTAVEQHSSGGAKMILMTGADLMAVLEGRIDLPTLLQRKKRYASQTGVILLHIHQIIGQ